MASSPNSTLCACAAMLTLSLPAVACILSAHRPPPPERLPPLPRSSAPVTSSPAPHACKGRSPHSKRHGKNRATPAQPLPQTANVLPCRDRSADRPRGCCRPRCEDSSLSRQGRPTWQEEPATRQSPPQCSPNQSTSADCPLTL